MGYMIASVLIFLLIIYTEYKLIKYICNPNEISNIAGLRKALAAAITYDVLALILMFLIFYIANNLDLGQMVHFFYHSVPAYAFEIAL